VSFSLFLGCCRRGPPPRDPPLFVGGSLQKEGGGFWGNVVRAHPRYRGLPAVERGFLLITNAILGVEYLTQVPLLFPGLFFAKLTERRTRLRCPSMRYFSYLVLTRKAYERQTRPYQWFRSLIHRSVLHKKKWEVHFAINDFVFSRATTHPWP